MKTLLFHPVNGIIRIQGCLFFMFPAKPGAIHLQRPVGSLPKTRWFDCRTRRWLGCFDCRAELKSKNAGEIGSEEAPWKFSSYFFFAHQKIWDSLRNFECWSSRSQLCKKSFAFGCILGQNTTALFFFPSLVYLSPRIRVMDACWCDRHADLEPFAIGLQKLVLPSLKHTMSMIPSLKKTIGKVDTIQWCIFDDPMVLPSAQTVFLCRFGGRSSILSRRCMT